jgi:hypothetical protein
MHGTFEWFANLYLQNGFRLGMVGASDDHRARPGHSNGGLDTQMQTAGLTAVVAPAKARDAVFGALRSRATYATSGERILLDARLNGMVFGSMVPIADLEGGVRLSCDVSGTSPLERIDVVKNGAVVLSRDLAGGALGERTWLRVGFQSSSEVFPPPSDNPRPYRVWQGEIVVTGARVVSVDASGLDNRYVERAELDPSSDGKRIRFHVETRGRLDPLLLELEGASAATTLRFGLEPSKEYGSQPTLVRPPAELPGEAFSVSMPEIAAGGAERTFQVDRHTDRIILELVDPGAGMDGSFQFADLEPPAVGDYYYLRVSQLDGGRAWSSPWWIVEEGGAP